MATKKLLKKIVKNWEAYYFPSSEEFVDLSSSQTIGWTKTFSTSPVVPSKTADATDTWTAIATEAQVYKKQDKLTAWTNITISWTTISATNTTYSQVSKSDMDTWTSTTAGVVSAKDISDFVAWKISSGVNYKGQVADYASLPSSPAAWDMYNVVAAHTTAPKFDAWTNVVWSGSAWDPMAEMVDLSDLVDRSTAQSVGWVKTFTSEPVLPSKTSDATNDWTKPATEAQVYKKLDSSSLWNATISIKHLSSSWSAIGSFTTNQSSNWTLAIPGEDFKTQAEYDSLWNWKTSDNNSYYIYESITVSD